MDLTELYKQYRDEQLAFVDEKLMKYLDEETVLNAAAALGMLDKKGKMVFDDENSLVYILDFAIYDFRINGKNLVERYSEEKGAENEAEERVLKAMLNSYSSLFRVVNVSPAKNMIFLKDTFNQSKNTRIMDITFSQSMNTEVLLFTRILPFPELNMTSGAPFVFPDQLEVPLTSEYKRAALHGIEDNPINKYIWFYNANKIQMAAQAHHHHEHDHDHHHHHDHDCGCGHEH